MDFGGVREGGREGLLTSSREGRRPSACWKAAERGLSVPNGYWRVKSSHRRMPEGGREGGREGVRGEKREWFSDREGGREGT